MAEASPPPDVTPPPPAEAEAEAKAEAPAEAEAGAKRGRAEDEGEGGAAEAGEAGPEAKKAKKGKKRKVAVFFAYVGEGYHGMQRNPGVHTLEDEMEKALHLAGGISKDNFGTLQKIHWMRSARTDKGVSAVGQVVSCKLVIEPEGVLDRINAHLPKDIIALGLRRVTMGFDARKMCDRRRYEYVLPEWAFDPSAHVGRREAEERAGNGAAAAEGPAAAQSEFALGAAGLARLNGLLKNYEGTHNFHNYTKGVDCRTAQAKRHMLSFHAEAFEACGERLVRCVVLGQSFMLHQIRKMIGMALAIMRGVAEERHQIIAMRTSASCNVPMAPELGLFLDETIFHAYNNRFPDHQPLTQADFKGAVTKFKHDRLYPHITGKEAREGTLKAWLKSLNDTNYKFSGWPRHRLDLKDKIHHHHQALGPAPAGAGAAAAPAAEPAAVADNGMELL